MKRTTSLYFVGLCILILLTNCRKDIDLPDPSLSKLFGSWEWLGSSGGFSGGSKTPASEGYNETLEFNSNGIYKSYRNGKKEDKWKIEIVADNDRPGNFIIKYSGTGVFNRGIQRKQEVSFRGNDTLYLDDGCCDRYGHLYVRKP